MKKYKYLGLVMMLLNFCEMNEAKACTEMSAMVEYVQLQNSKEKQNRTRAYAQKVVIKDSNSPVSADIFTRPMVLSDLGFLFKWIRGLFSSFNLV